MTSEEKELIRSSFARIGPDADLAAEHFYSFLFELDPRLRALFKGDMREQGRKLMHMVGMAVNSIERLETLLPSLRALGARHATYGVKDQDYATVGAAFLAMLEAMLGPAFTPAVRAAGSNVYALLSSAMREAAVAV